MRTLSMRVANLLICGLIGTGAHAAQQLPTTPHKGFARPDDPFVSIGDPHRQAEQWAICSATFDTLAWLVTEAGSPARGQQLRELANGAKVAVAMTFVSDSMGRISELPADQARPAFASAWRFAQHSMASLPETEVTKLRAEFEAASQAGELEAFVGQLTATMEICGSNGDGQQMYVDLWRELLRSGMVTEPEGQ